METWPRCAVSAMNELAWRWKWPDFFIHGKFQQFEIWFQPNLEPNKKNFEAYFLKEILYVVCYKGAKSSFQSTIFLRFLSCWNSLIWHTALVLSQGVCSFQIFSVPNPVAPVTLSLLLTRCLGKAKIFHIYPGLLELQLHRPSGHSLTWSSLWNGV